MAEHVNKDNFNTKVLESSLPVLVVVSIDSFKETRFLHQGLIRNPSN